MGTLANTHRREWLAGNSASPEPPKLPRAQRLLIIIGLIIASWALILTPFFLVK